MSELKKFDEPIELQRLRKLQVLIETDMWFNKNVKLDMGTWKIENKCGTTACLCGMYAISYPEDGLELISSNYPGEFSIKYRANVEFTAAEEFFGLSGSRARRLFNAVYYRDSNPEEIKTEALRRIKRMIKEKVACLS